MITPRYPSCYQINTRVWLTEISHKLGRAATLDDIPDIAFDRLGEFGFDWVWFLSVWQTGLVGRCVARATRSGGRDFKRRYPTSRRGHRGFRVRHRRLHHTRRSGRRCRSGPPARETPPARPTVDARLRSQSYCFGSFLGGGLSRLLRTRQPTGPGPASRKLYASPKQARRSDSRLRTRSIFSGLAGHPSTQLRQPSHAGSDDRGTGESRRAM